MKSRQPHYHATPQPHVTDAALQQLLREETRPLTRVKYELRPLYDSGCISELSLQMLPAIYSDTPQPHTDDQQDYGRHLLDTISDEEVLRSCQQAHVSCMSTETLEQFTCEGKHWDDEHWLEQQLLANAAL